jgi:hypothetical protein
VKLVRADLAVVPVTETLFFVVENHSTVLPVYQIQMWHVTVLRVPANAVSTQIPHKEI